VALRRRQRLIERRQQPRRPHRARSVQRERSRCRGGCDPIYGHRFGGKYESLFLHRRFSKVLLTAASIQYAGRIIPPAGVARVFNGRPTLGANDPSATWSTRRPSSLPRPPTRHRNHRRMDWRYRTLRRHRHSSHSACFRSVHTRLCPVVIGIIWGISTSRHRFRRAQLEAVVRIASEARVESSEPGVRPRLDTPLHPHRDLMRERLRRDAAAAAASSQGPPPQCHPQLPLATALLWNETAPAGGRARIRPARLGRVPLCRLCSDRRRTLDGALAAVLCLALLRGSAQCATLAAQQMEEHRRLVGISPHGRTVAAAGAVGLRLRLYYCCSAMADWWMQDHDLIFIMRSPCTSI